MYLGLLIAVKHFQMGFLRTPINPLLVRLLFLIKGDNYVGWNVLGFAHREVNTYAFKVLKHD